MHGHLTASTARSTHYGRKHCKAHLLAAQHAHRVDSKAAESAHVAVTRAIVVHGSLRLRRLHCRRDSPCSRSHPAARRTSDPTLARACHAQILLGRRRCVAAGAALVCECHRRCRLPMQRVRKGLGRRRSVEVFVLAPGAAFVTGSAWAAALSCSRRVHEAAPASPPVPHGVGVRVAATRAIHIGRRSTAAPCRRRAAATRGSCSAHVMWQMLLQAERARPRLLRLAIRALPEHSGPAPYCGATSCCRPGSRPGAAHRAASRLVLIL